MSTATTEPAQAAPARTELTTAPRSEPAPVRQRRRPALIGLGIALVALGPLVGAWVGMATDESVSVIALATDKEAGQRLQTADLRAVSITADPADLPAIPVTDADRVTGMMLTGNAPAGTLLLPGMLSAEPRTPDGTHVVGIPVTPGQMPAVGLRPGDQVTLVVGATQTNQQQGAAMGEEESLTAPGRTWQGTVVTVGGPTTQDVTGSITVDVAIPATSSSDVAAAAASRSMSIVLTPHEQDEDR